MRREAGNAPFRRTCTSKWERDAWVRREVDECNHSKVRGARTDKTLGTVGSYGQEEGEDVKRHGDSKCLQGFDWEGRDGCDKVGVLH